MIENAILAQKHGKDHHALLACADHIAQKGKGGIGVARYLRIHHLEHRAFGGTGTDGVDILRRYDFAFVQIAGKLVHLLFEKRSVAAYGEHQLPCGIAAHLLAEAAHGFACPVGTFCVIHGRKVHDGVFLFQLGVQLFAPVRLALDIKHKAGGGGDVRKVIRDGFHLALILAFAACGNKGTFADDHQTLFTHERQRFGCGDERVGVGVVKLRQVHLLKPCGQKLAAQLLERGLLDVFLIAFKEVAFADAVCFELVEESGMVHGRFLS